MTNAEKYEEVFGMPLDTAICPTSDCNVCPCANLVRDEDGISIACTSSKVYEWWKSEYKEKNNDVQ